jgi:hypothetical protein
MKRLNKFSLLPKEDQTFILNLCEKMTYKQACLELAKPRGEGGLGFTTSPSDLCKFNTRHHPEAIATEAWGQFASAIRVQHQAHGEANFQALVQNRLLEAMRAGKPLADLDKDFRTLQRVQKCFLADEKFRHNNERTQDAYLTFVKRASTSESQADYIDNTLDEDPGAGNANIQDFEEEPTQLDLDLDFARTMTIPEISPHSTFLRAAARIVAIRRAAELKSAYLKSNNVNPAFAMPELDPANVTPASLLKLQQQQYALDQFRKQVEAQKQNQQEISSPNTSKTPVISTISNNFQSPEKGRQDSKIPLF